MPETAPRHESSPYELGKTARLMGQLLRDNPYQLDAFRGSWEAGWEQADGLIRSAADAYEEEQEEE